MQAGDRLGLYEILGPLGAGGMGEVYRARDTKLNRYVVIRVLPAALANDADYQREAQALDDGITTARPLTLVQNWVSRLEEVMGS